MTMEEEQEWISHTEEVQEQTLYMLKAIIQTLRMQAQTMTSTKESSIQNSIEKGKQPNVMTEDLDTQQIQTVENMGRKLIIENKERTFLINQKEFEDKKEKQMKDKINTLGQLHRTGKIKRRPVKPASPLKKTATERLYQYQTIVTTIQGDLFDDLKAKIRKMIWQRKKARIRLKGIGVLIYI